MLSAGGIRVVGAGWVRAFVWRVKRLTASFAEGIVRQRVADPLVRASRGQSVLVLWTMSELPISLAGLEFAGCAFANCDLRTLSLQTVAPEGCGGAFYRRTRP